MKSDMKPGIVTEVEKYVKGWSGGLPETPCGFGSKLDQTILQRKVLARWCEQYGIHSIVDVGAGDLNWVKEMKWPHPVHYSPLDLVPRHNIVQPFNLIESVPPDCDMVWCLWVLNHLPEDHARVALGNLKQTKAKYLVYTWWPAMADFLDLYPVEHVTIRPNIGAELRLVSLC